MRKVHLTAPIKSVSSSQILISHLTKQSEVHHLMLRNIQDCCQSSQEQKTEKAKATSVAARRKKRTRQHGLVETSGTMPL